MANIPQKPVIENQIWINGQTKLNQTNLTNGVNQNITNLKTAVDGIIDALGGPGGESASDKTLDQSSISVYNPATTYSQGQVVIHNDAGGVASYYRCNESGVTGTWDENKWSKIALSTPVDSALDEDSTNPVQNKVVTAAINGLEANVDKIFDDLAPEYSASSVYEVGDYCLHEGNLYKCAVKIASGEAWNAAHWEVANVGDDLKGKITLGSGWYDGTGGVNYADVSDNWTPYSDESGAFQSEPFISQGTGTDNNTSIVTTGNYAQLREKQGNSLVVNNQLNITTSTTGLVLTKTENADGSITFTNNTGNTVNNPKLLNLNGGKVVKGHKYVFLYKTSIGNNNYLRIWDSTASINTYPNNISSANINLTNLKELYLIGSVANGVSFTLYKVLVDLTQMFKGNIPQDLLSHPNNFFRYYNGSLAYNAGSLENSNGVKLMCTHRQLWDEVATVGGYIKEDGTIADSASSFYGANLKECVPNRPYYVYLSVSKATYIAWYDKNGNFISRSEECRNSVVTSPANACFFKPTVLYYGTTFAKGLTVSLYYTPEEGGEGYNQHYDYEEPTVVDTGSEQLLPFDTKDPNGTIHRNTLEYTFTGNETYATWGSNGAFLVTTRISVGLTNNFVMAEFIKYTYNEINNGQKIGAVIANGNPGSGMIGFYDPSKFTSIAELKVYLTGKTILIRKQKAYSTTEQGTPFPENVDIDDYGMMYWLDENDELVGIPQGAKFFYPANYKGFIDDAYSYLGGDAQKIIRTYETDPDAIVDNPHVNDNWDTTPTSGSTKPVTSGGIYEAISEITITEMTDDELLAVQNIITGN